MPFRRARTIDELYELTRDADLVLTPDAPLALALNRRVSEPRLGVFASTPANYVRRGLDLPDKRELFHEVIRRTEIPWKRAAATLELVLKAWEETGQREGILAYPTYVDRATREIVEVLATVESQHRARAELQIPDDLKVSVIGLEDFSALDRSILPSQVSQVERFVPGERFELPGVHLVPSSGAVVGTLEALITPDNAGETAIVLDPAGAIRPMVESMLDARGIPYRTDEGLSADGAVRAFLRLVRFGLSRDRLRGRDVRGVLSGLGIRLWPTEDDKRLDQMRSPAAGEVLGFWQELEQRRMGEALDRFQELVGTEQGSRGASNLEPVRELVRELGLTDAPVTTGVLNGLEFYLDTFEIGTERHDEGVLLASALSNAYVDAARVFYLGMDAAWNEDVPNLPWIVPKERKAANRRRFELLVQNGRQPVYLVQDTREGHPVVPCFHFHELLDDMDDMDEMDDLATLDEPFQRFTDLDPTPIAPPEPAAGPGFQHAPIEGAGDEGPDLEPITTLSASSLNKLLVCPRDYFMDRLVRTPEAAPLVRGSLFHAFAEAYVNAPDAFATDEAMGEVTELLLEHLAAFLEDEDQATARTEIRVGLGNLKGWLEANPPRPGGVPAGYAAPEQGEYEHRNVVSDHFDIELTSPQTERWFEHEGIALKGKVDLVHSTEHLVDYKSGKNPDSSGKTMRKALPEEEADEAGVQPSVYLAHHRHHAPDRTLRFTFLDFLSNTNDVLRGDASLSDTERVVWYHDRSFPDHVATRQAYEWVQSSAKREDVIGTVGYAAWQRFWTQHADALPPFTDADAVLGSELCEAFIALGKEKRGDFGLTEDACTSTLKQLVKLREQHLFREDLDAFQDRVLALRDTLNEVWLPGRFPVGHVDADKRAHPDLVLTELDPREGSP